MRIKNVFKVLFSNVNVLYKAVIFRLLVTSLIALIAYFAVFPGLKPLFISSETTELVNAAKAVFYNFFNGKDIDTQTLPACYDAFITMLEANVGSLFLVGMEAFILLFILRVVSRAGEYSFCKVFSSYMSSRSKMGFMSSLICELGRAFLYSIVYVPISLAVQTIIFVAGISFAVYGLKLISIFSILIGLMFIVCATAFKQTVLSAFMPAMAVDGQKVGTALKNCFPKGKRFSELMGLYIFFIVFFFYINVSVGVFTFLCGLIVSLPFTMLCFTLAATVDYYQHTNKKYYVDDDSIIVPKEMLENAEYLKHM